MVWDVTWAFMYKWYGMLRGPSVLGGMRCYMGVSFKWYGTLHGPFDLGGMGCNVSLHI